MDLLSIICMSISCVCVGINVIVYVFNMLKEKYRSSFKRKSTKKKRTIQYGAQVRNILDIYSYLFVCRFVIAAVTSSLNRHECVKKRDLIPTRFLSSSEVVCVTSAYNKTICYMTASLTSAPHISLVFSLS